MKKILALLFLTAGTSGLMHAQDSDAAELSLFRGGQLNLDFRLGLNFNGFGPGTSMMGGITSGRMNSGPGALLTNPAELAYTRRGVFVLDGHPGAGVWSSTGYTQSLMETINDEIVSGTDDVLNDTAAFLKTPDAYISHTKLQSMNAGFAARFGAFAMALPVTDRLTAAVSVSQPIDMRLRLNASGMSAKIAQEQGSEDVALRFDVLMNIGLLGRFDLVMNQADFGFGYLAWTNSRGHSLSAGFSATRYEFENRRFLDTDLSGMVVIGGADERFFNNPDDVNLNSEAGEQNGFYLRTAGRFTDRQWGYRGGVMYRRSWLNASLAYHHMPKFNLTDPNATGEAALPVFMVGDDIFKSLEVALDSLEAAKPNLTTVRDVSKFTKGFRWEMPSSLTAAVDMDMGMVTMTLNYMQYMGDFRYGVGSDVYTLAAPKGVGVGFDLKAPDRFATWHQLYIFPLRLLFLDIDGILFQAARPLTGYSDPHYRIGFRGLLGENATTGSVNPALSDLMGLPVFPIGFSMGREYTLHKNLRIGVTTFAFPDLMFRFSAAYQF